MSFNSSFAAGKRGENFVKKLFALSDIECELNEEKDKLPYYDLVCKVGKKRFTCEVKFDIKAQFTGNIAIEYHNSRKNEASGLAKTTSDIWIHLIQDGANITAWITKTKDLSNFCAVNNPKFIANDAGDGNADLLIYSQDVLLGHVLTRIDNLEKDDLKKVLKGFLK